MNNSSNQIPVSSVPKGHFAIYKGPRQWDFAMKGFLLKRVTGGIHSLFFTVDPYFLPETPNSIPVRAEWDIQLLGRVRNALSGTSLMFFAHDHLDCSFSRLGLIGEYNMQTGGGKFRFATKTEARILEMMSFGAGHQDF